MNRRKEVFMKKFLVLLAALCFLAGLAGTAAAAPATFFDFNDDKIEDAVWEVFPGDIFTADIYFSGNNPEDGILSMGVELMYDAALVQVNSITIPLFSIDPPAALWSVLFNESRWDNSTGMAFFESGTASPIGIEPVPLAEVVFECLGIGELVVTMGEPDPSSLTLDSFVTGSGTVLDKEIAFGVTQINQVPIPGAILLLAPGLLGLLGLRRKLRK
jgi:hypothetical protein